MIDRAKINEICEKIGLDPADFADNLTGTALKGIALFVGVDESAISDNLYSTFLKAAAEQEGVDLSSLKNPNLYSELIDALVEAAHPNEPSDSSLVGTGTVDAMLVGEEDIAA